MARKSRISDETIAEWDRQREEFTELMRLRDERLACHEAALAAAEARRAARRAQRATLVARPARLETRRRSQRSLLGRARL